MFNVFMEIFNRGGPNNFKSKTLKIWLKLFLRKKKKQQVKFLLHFQESVALAPITTTSLSLWLFVKNIWFSPNLSEWQWKVEAHRSQITQPRLMEQVGTEAEVLWFVGWRPSYVSALNWTISTFLLSPVGETGTSRRVYPHLAPTSVLVGIPDINREVDIQSQNRKQWKEKQRIG